MTPLGEIACELEIAEDGINHIDKLEYIYKIMVWLSYSEQHFCY